MTTLGGFGSCYTRVASGIDLPVPPGTPVLATGAGRVTQTFTDHPVLGVGVVIEMDNELTTLSAHLYSYGDFGIGAYVNPGDTIGFSGNTGMTRGDGHLHFTVWPPGANIPNFRAGQRFTEDDFFCTIDPLTVLPPQ